MAAGWRHLGFDMTRNSAIRSADPENPRPTLEPNVKRIGSLAADYDHSRIMGQYGTPFWGNGRS